MAYTKAQAKKIAEQIHSRFGGRITTATTDTPVPPEFVAGLIGVEAGKDRDGRISETASRFEPHVFAKLKGVRDGKVSQYSRITKRDLAGASDEALKALARSYGLTQIMGWWTIHLGGTVADLRDPNKHLNYTIKLLLLNSKGDFERGKYAGEFKQWNTGSETGKTYHADYVTNATAVMDAYAELDLVEGEPLVTDSVTEDPKVEEPAASPQAEQPGPQINIEHADQVKTDTPAQPIEGGRKDDDPKQASQGGTKSTIATALGVITGIGTAVKGVMAGNSGIMIVGIVCVTVVLLAWMFRQFILDYLRMRYMSDPTKINVK